MTKDLALVEIGAPLAASGLPPSRAAVPTYLTLRNKSDVLDS